MASLVLAIGMTTVVCQTAASAGAAGEPPADDPVATSEAPAGSAVTPEVAGGDGPAPEKAPAPAPARALVLVVGQGPILVPPARAAVVQCSPKGGGTHPRPAQACALLKAAGGDIQRLRPSSHVVCPAIYEPETVSSVGVWDDHFVLSVRTFSNNCELRNTLRSVVEF
ncbi:SSI family serine proteinase inhibitor [Sphaerisporangium sp. TRM90804]|uniref:SSI family serine proteinase inhibitor n=1 Tax=Sphaerisporangium sp. TRM90804 TaxID=3031113 RepID=UPI00244CF8BF|nr:SSI family serine proteinase inhibitor [Sphaerisporangium sp. TRM90804]MDH2430036.1 SSI family serine proteinase inhibitor [Sphaerisporangium sp. TRM90804]